MANGQFDWNTFLSGYSPTAGGTDILGNPIPGQIPGGGAIGGAAGIVGGVIDLIGNKKRTKDQQDLLDRAKDDVAKYKKDFASGMYDMQVSQAQRDLAMMGIRPTDTSGIQSASATALQAASADPRVLGGMLGNIQRNQAQQMQQQQMADMKREIAAKSNLANIEQQTLNANRGLRQRMGLMGLAESTAARNQALQNIEALKAEKRGAWADILGGVANVGMSLAAPGLGLGSALGGGGAAPTNMQPIPSLPPSSIPSPLESSLNAWLQSNNVMYKSGGSVSKTPGPFSHKTNPIDIMKDGAKIGEMTGGEYIINPDQADAIEDAYESIKEKQSSGKKISRQDLMMLYDVIRGVFSQPQFQDEEDDEEED
jgi:hypothetical protein